MKLYKVVAIVSAAILLSIACGNSPTGPSGGLDTQISENAVDLDNMSGVTIVSITADQVVLNCSDSIPSIEAGDCILTSEIVGDYWGCIRLVSSVDVDDYTVTVQTTQGKLTDAIVQCTDDTTYSLTMGKMTGGSLNGSRPCRILDGVSVRGTSLNLSNVTLFSGNVGGSDLTVTITSGIIEFEPVMDIGWEIENSQLTEFYSVASGDLTFNCDIEATLGGSLSYSADTTLASFSQVYVQFIGWVPVVEVVTLSFIGGFDVQANGSGSVSTGFDHSNIISVGAEYDGSWESVWEYNPTLSGHQTNWSAGADLEIRGYVCPVVSVDLYGILGPYIKVEPYLGFNAGTSKDRLNVSDRNSSDSFHYVNSGGSFSPKSWWELVGGVTGTLGFDISILGYSLADFNTSLFEWETVLDGEGTSPGDRYMPIDQGNTWDFHSWFASAYYDSITGSEELVISGSYQHDAGFQVFGATSYVEGSYWQDGQVVDTYSYTSPAFLRESDTGVFLYESLSDEGNQLLDYPLQVGDTWNSGGWGSATVEDLDASTSVPAGFFVACARINYVSSSYDRYVHYAPDVGVVRIEDYSGALQNRWVLTGYGTDDQDGAGRISTEHAAPTSGAEYRSILRGWVE